MISMKETLITILLAFCILIWCIAAFLLIVFLDSKYEKSHPQPETQLERTSRICEEKGGIYSPGGFGAGRCDFPPQ